MVAVEVLEAVWQCSHFGRILLPLSPQMLLDCINQNPKEKEQDECGCYPLSPFKAYKWLKMNEVYAEQDYPYQKRRGPCQIIAQPSERMKVSTVKPIPSEKRLHIFARVLVHPVAAAVEIYNEFLEIKDEIYEGPKKLPKKDVMLHAVAIIGYGTEGEGSNANNYWLIMNSWGDRWGVRGVGKVSRDEKVKGRYLVRRICYPVL
ncbi:hypothetical protein DITRI_Ditri05aG0011700 [Diplodiscus trichospermus]